jgi:hypothetical protein
VMTAHHIHMPNARPGSPLYAHAAEVGAQSLPDVVDILAVEVAVGREVRGEGREVGVHHLELAVQGDQTLDQIHTKPRTTDTSTLL